VSRRISRWKPWLFLLPALIIYLTVILVPSVYTLVLSFFQWNGASADMVPVGWRNYVDLFTIDTVFRKALLNTFLWTFMSLIVMTSLSLALALALNQKIRGRLLFRGVFYFPCILSGVVVAITWRWMYHPSQGIINGSLELIGLSKLAMPWLAQTSTALGSVFVASVWFGLGQPMVLFLAGLQTIPKEPYEAALIDGASPSQSFRKITIPLLSETFVIVLATVFIAGMRVYDVIFAMTGGGPAESTQVLSSWMYFQSFSFANVGVGSAISWILIALSMIVIIPYVRFTAKRGEQ
jgi:raffinose/stachyose/melibiose transport system permease protein